jgi:chemotaxis protein CheY-P-specific phosphatase CheC
MSEETPGNGSTHMHALANVGAAAAAAAMAHLLGHRIQASPTRPCRDEDAEPGKGGAVVLFEATGSLSGVIGLVLPGETCDSVLRVLLRETEVDAASEAADSALRELGNIVASQTISAIANVLGGRILLSVPKLVVDDLGEVLRTLEGPENWLSLESDLDGGDGTFQARLLFSISVG